MKVLKAVSYVDDLAMLRALEMTNGDFDCCRFVAERAIDRIRAVEGIPEGVTAIRATEN